MAAGNTSFMGAMPGYYDRCIGPAYFEPFAAELAQRLPADSTRDVLEIACGTGLVTRRLRERMHPRAKLVATDLSAPMLDYARTKLAGVAGIEWREANAMKLPFDDGAFGAVACGFGIMFVPDKPAALREAGRVLADGGELHFTVWDGLEANPHAAASSEVVEGMRPGDPELRFRIPFEMNDPALLRNLLDGAGFIDVRLEAKRLPVASDSARTLAEGAIRGTPRSLMLEERGISLDEVIDKLAARLAQIGGAAPYRGHAQAVVVQARKGA